MSHLIVYLIDVYFDVYSQKGYTRELELEPGKKYIMTTMATKPPIFGKL